jgi:hypothetical protein
MKSMKESTSTTNLTNLAEACHFCAEGADAEAGNRLVQSQEFLSCKCRFSTHKECWLQYIQSTPMEPMAKCPPCKVVVPSWQKAFLNHLSVEEKSKGYDIRCILFLAVLSVIAMVALVAGFTVGRS